MSDASDRMKHKAEEAVGAAKEKTGAAAGNERLENEGRGDQAESQAKQGVDKAKDRIAEGVDKVKGAFKR
ncbi:CsbD-like protein [Kitasatospora sp. SolWspMP-SS2h]|uniref:CsbD family protein n=1 Tax=Kitasatospora sp. SolWspMP-SS2h TaxID=1305729 RepID=UPI000DB93914|nr:CsbD family protein [Kitasatospora sp. SolWspMP-SS2h]RAJ45614.1 CsbD-like protein [Kitasatospora sp. SolWspMP-SS2h]